MPGFFESDLQQISVQASPLLHWATHCVSAWILSVEVLFLGAILWYAWRREMAVSSGISVSLSQRLWRITWVLVPALVLLAVNLLSRPAGEQIPTGAAAPGVSVLMELLPASASVPENYVDQVFTPVQGDQSDRSL